jgi:hypothetical protein
MGYCFRFYKESMVPDLNRLIIYLCGDTLKVEIMHDLQVLSDV